MIPLAITLLISESLRDRISVLVIVIIASPIAFAIVDLAMNHETDAACAWATKYLLRRIDKDGRLRELTFLPLGADGLPKEDALRKWLASNYPAWDQPLVVQAIRRLLMNNKRQVPI